MSAGLRYPWSEPPASGVMQEVADGVFWARLPLPMALDHVNVYLFDDGDGWTLVDTGLDWPEGRAALEAVLSALPDDLTRVLVTHHHPDHVGLAGLLQSRGAELLMPRTGWLTARMLWLDEQDAPTAQTIAHWRGAGMPQAMIDAKSTARPFNFRDAICELPLGFTALEDGARIRMGRRNWQVRFGQGHAPDHATLWEEGGNLVVAGDQMLPGISPNISLYPTEPEADPLGGWLESCARLAGFARQDHLVLCGHKLPFLGLPLRLAQLEQNHRSALERLRAHIAEPKLAAQCFGPLFKRKVGEDVYTMALGEAMAHLMHLAHVGEAKRWRRSDGAWLWQAL